MKQFKLTILLTVLLSMVGARALAHDFAVANADGVTIYYNKKSNTEVAVTYQGRYYHSVSNEYWGTVVIPESVVYNGTTYSVTSIGSNAFDDCSNLTSVTIPNSVTSIDSYAFDDCSGLTSITIPNSVTSISVGAFSRCWGLTSITIGNSVTNIGISAFFQCIGLTSVTIPNSVTSIGSGAFHVCSGLTSITIPNSVTSIGHDAFDNTAWYNNQPDGLIYAGKVAYKYKGTMPANTNIILDEGTLGIAGSAFSSCQRLTSITIPNSVINIGENAFSYCSGLTSVTIPNSVTSIGNYAFYNTYLKSITIGSGVLSIGSDAFSYSNDNGTSQGSKPVKVIWLTNTPPNGYSNAAGTINYVANDQYIGLSNKTVYPFLSSMFEVGGVKYVPVSPSERTCDAIDCVYGDAAEHINIGTTASYMGIGMTVLNVKPYVCYQNKSIKDIQLTCNTNVGNYAFSGCTGANTITVSNQGNIGNSAFSGCTGANTITVSNQGNVGNYAFYGCTGANTVTVSNQGNIGASAFAGITGSFTASVNNTGQISYEAFYQSTGLTSLEIGTNVTNIGDECFFSCTSLTTANLQNKGTVNTKAFQNCTALQTATLGADITSIGSYAFDGCSQLQGIVIPDAVTTLGEYAFQNCTSLASATTGNGITAINPYAFNGCTALTNMQIGSAVKTIDTNAFNGCTALAELAIPSNVTSIKDNVFYGCNHLAKVTMADSQELLTLGSNGSNPLFSSCPLDEVYIGRNISYDTSSSKGYSPFYRNTSLRAVTITDKETEISPNEFYGCTGLKQITIGDGVESIGSWAFSGCSSLESFSFGYSVETIGQEAFSDCTAMTTIVSRAQTPPTCGTQALDDINKFTCKLKVPQGYLAAYQQANQWKEFFFIEDDVEGVVFPTVTAENKTREYGEENPELTYTVTDGELTGTPELTTEAVKTSPVGDYAITVNKGSITGKYNAVNGTLSVTKAPLKITAQSYTIKQGQPLPEFAATYEGFKNEETEDVLTVKPTMTTTATSASEPGEYDITVSGAEADNYEITYVKGKLTITDADAIIITAKSYTRKYGEENPVFEYTVEGAALEGEPQITCEATATSPVGTYPIIITKGSVTNFNDTYVNGTLTIEKAPLTVKAEDASRTEGEENPTFVISYEGFKNGETEDVLTVKPTATTDATQSSPAGIYVIVVSGGEAQNYTLNYINGTLTVTESTGIESLTIDSDDVEWYTLNGLRVKTPRKGVYIVKLKDGTVKRVVVK